MEGETARGEIFCAICLKFLMKRGDLNISRNLPASGLYFVVLKVAETVAEPRWEVGVARDLAGDDVLQQVAE